MNSEIIKNNTKKNLPILLLFLLFLWFGTEIACFAQVSTGQILKSEEILQKEEALRKKLKEQEKVYIKKIIVEGTSLLTDEEIKAVISPFQKHWLTKEDIQQILSLLRQVYAQKGYIGESVRVSYQVERKQLKIKVEELTH